MHLQLNSKATGGSTKEAVVNTNTDVSGDSDIDTDTYTHQQIYPQIPLNGHQKWTPLKGVKNGRKVGQIDLMPLMLLLILRNARDDNIVIVVLVLVLVVVVAGWH